MPVRSGRAIWEGTLREGKGTLALGGGAFEGAYSYSSRFEEGTGTNPEELIAAAHAGCFSMALSGALVRAGFPPERIETTAKVSLTAAPAGGFEISKITLTTKAAVPGIELAAFTEVAEAAKKNCPVSKALAAVEIVLEAALA